MADKKKGKNQEKPSMTNKIQDKAMDALKKKDGKVVIRTLSGDKHLLDVRSVDRYTLIGLENEDDEDYTMLFKHGIESIRVPRKIKKEETDD